MPDEYKDRYIIIALLKTPPRYFCRTPAASIVSTLAPRPFLSAVSSSRGGTRHTPPLGSLGVALDDREVSKYLKFILSSYLA